MHPDCAAIGSCLCLPSCAPGACRKEDGYDQLMQDEYDEAERRELEACKPMPGEYPG